MMKMQSGKTPWRRVVAVLVVAASTFASGQLSAQNLNGAFKEAIASSNKRMVKIYGATAGRVDGYSSGVIVSADGLIVTMQGVYLDGNNTRIVMHDGAEHQATVLRRHRSLQLALLKIDTPTPDHFKLSDGEVGKKGDWVVTLSNAFKVANLSLIHI